MANEDERKVCFKCGRSLKLSNFHEVNSFAIEDGRVDMCSRCVDNHLAKENENIFYRYLRTLDKPFIQDLWDKVAKEKTPYKVYITKISNLVDYRDLRWEDTENVKDLKTILSEQDAKQGILKVKDKMDKTITLDDDIVAKWRGDFEYSPEEYLKLEKFYRDFKYDYDISDATSEYTLMDICRLSIEKDRLMSEQAWGDYDKANKAYNTAMQTAGFRPIDKQEKDASNTVSSAGQIIDIIEREGFVNPDVLEFEKDDIDKMLLYYEQGIQRFSDEQVAESVPDNWREQIADSDNIFDKDAIKKAEEEDTSDDSDE